MQLLKQIPEKTKGETRHGKRGAQRILGYLGALTLPRTYHLNSISAQMYLPDALRKYWLIRYTEVPHVKRLKMGCYGCYTWSAKDGYNTAALCTLLRAYDASFDVL